MNSYGQLGDGTTIERHAPVAVSGLSSGVIAVSGSLNHSVAIRSDGSAIAWGWNIAGQLGDGTTIERHAPVAVSGLSSGVVAIAAGGYHNLALKADGSVVAWGLNNFGQLGDGTNIERHTPVAVMGLGSGVVAIAAGAYHNVALKADGSVVAWGENNWGQLGDGTIDTRWAPGPVSALSSGVVAIAVGGYHNVALKSDGSVVAWGYNGYGQLGDGTWGAGRHSTAPVAVTGLNRGVAVAAIAAGAYHSLALMSDGAVLAWGGNDFGQLGDGTTAFQRSTPVAVVGLSSGVAAIAAAAGSLHTLALKSDGSVVAWGDNGSGQLGDGTRIQQIAPVAVGGIPSRVLGVAAGWQHSFALVAGNHSLALDGTTGYAEVPNAAKLNLAGDWTIEAWFKDESVGGYDHDWAKIVSKMDANVSGEGPYYLAIGRGLLKAGSLHEGIWRSVVYDLGTAGVSAGVWHHAAATLQASSRTVTLYLDGLPVMTGTVDALGEVNDLPLSIGRSGTVGNYWTGKIDDLRIWNTTRTAAQIAANYLTEYASPPAGLIANWKFNETSGTTVADSTAVPADAVLDGGATFSMDSHP